MPGTGDGHRELARRISAVAGADVRDLRATGAQHGWRHYAVTLASGREAFAKVSGTDTGPAFDAEARGLRWLAEAEGDGRDIPDPYGGDSSDFGTVLDLIEAAARRIAAQLTELLAGRAPA